MATRFLVDLSLGPTALGLKCTKSTRNLEPMLYLLPVLKQKDLQISGMAARLMMWLHARSCVLPSFEWTSSNYHCSLPDSAYRQQQALLIIRQWSAVGELLAWPDQKCRNFGPTRTKNYPGPKFRDRPQI